MSRTRTMSMLDLRMEQHLEIFIGMMQGTQHGFPVVIMGVEDYVIIPNTHYLGETKPGATITAREGVTRVDLFGNSYYLSMEQFFELLPKEQQEPLIWHMDKL